MKQKVHQHTESNGHSPLSFVTSVHYTSSSGDWLFNDILSTVVVAYQLVEAKVWASILLQVIKKLSL
jgi:hypothetical protein